MCLALWPVRIRLFHQPNKCACLIYRTDVEAYFSISDLWHWWIEWEFQEMNDSVSAQMRTYLFDRIFRISLYCIISLLNFYNSYICMCARTCQSFPKLERHFDWSRLYRSDSIGSDLLSLQAIGRQAQCVLYEKFNSTKSITNRGNSMSKLIVTIRFLDPSTSILSTMSYRIKSKGFSSHSAACYFIPQKAKLWRLFIKAMRKKVRFDEEKRWGTYASLHG
ncbi:unnamed protein product [Albugo candida]|uniref:Uncharacterized protein n=1 Tax=Albugo candida TaxID=65357 RepID=A0A024G9H3_9STRA|nr:unnamed protein product [Albugo candida]|eukprot:CCI43526.1 unnamed protein product [Albugo candida]